VNVRASSFQRRPVLTTVSLYMAYVAAASVPKPRHTCRYDSCHARYMHYDDMIYMCLRSIVVFLTDESEERAVFLGGHPFKYWSPSKMCAVRCVQCSVPLCHVFVIAARLVWLGCSCLYRELNHGPPAWTRMSEHTVAGQRLKQLS
jgi:hypothetical protein